MDMKKLLEAVTKFSGEEVGQKSGDQWRGTDKGTPGKKLVGDSIIKDLSKGATPKTKEQELAEEWAMFSEEDLGTHPKRAGRKSDRHARGHEPKPRYTTVKADESYDSREAYDKWDPKHPDFKSNWEEYKAKNPDGKLQDFINKLRGKKVNEGWAQGSDRVSLPDDPHTYWSGTGALQKEYDALYAKLVPSQGAAETIEGEVLRAASKIVYRHYNDGDEFNKASFDQLKAYIGTVTSYDDLAHKATEYALKANGNYHPNAGWDSLDVMDYGPTDDDDEEDEDDWYDDEDEDDLEEAKHFKTAYGWAGGRNEKTGGTYKHPDQIKADREAKKAAKAKQSKDSFDSMFGGDNPAKGLGIREGAEQDPIVAKVVKQMRPGLTGLNMGNEAFLYFAYELGKQRARDAWSDYLPSIRAEYEKGLNESGGNYEGTKRRLKNSDPFVVVDKTLGAVICTSDSLDKAKKQAIEWAEYDDIYTVVIQKDTQRSVFKVNGYADAEKYLGEGWESGPKEYEEPYDDADDAYDRQRQEKIDTEAEKEWAKLPKVSTYKLIGRGPNMEPNHEFGDEFDSMEQALDYRAEIMKDPKTPHPEHIGIRTITRVVDKEQTDENSVTTPKNPEHAKQMMKDLGQLGTQVPNPDPELAATIARRKDILVKQAKELGIDESRAHKILNTWFKDRERQEKFAKGELTVPTPQERNVKIEKPKAKKEKVNELSTGDAVQKPVYAQSAGATGLPDVSKLNPQQKKDLAARVDPDAEKKAAAAVASLKSATGSTASPDKLMKALDSADQGKSADAQTMSALQPVMDVVRKAGTNPKLSGTLKSLINQAKTV
jgi:hypothetical protein